MYFNKIHFTKTVTSIVLILVIYSCSTKETRVAPPSKVQVIEVMQSDVPVPLEFVGQTYGYKDIPIRARVDGFLTGLYFQEGSMVKKGQLLYSIDPDQYNSIVAQRNSGLAEAQTRLAKAESDLSRMRPLAQIKAVSQSDLDAAVADYEASIAQVEAQKAQLNYAKINLGYTQITSPISGIIGITEAKTGEYVGKAPNPVVLNTVSIIDTILVNFSVSEADFLEMLRNLKKKAADAVEKGENLPEANAKISLILADGSLYDYQGSFNFADRQVDPATGTILFQVAFPNPDRLLRPGQFARIRVVIDELKGALLIPQRCVIELQGVYQVYTISDSNNIVIQGVKLGSKVGGMWIVESGLSPNEKVVFEGLNLVRPGQIVNPETVKIPEDLINF